MSLPMSSPGPARLARRRLLAGAALSAVVLLSACSSPAPDNAGATSASPTAASTSTTTSPSPGTASPSAAEATATADSTAAPSARSAVKELVTGFPAGVLPLLKGATIQASSIEHSEPVSTASLTATTTATTAEIFTYYTGIFTGQGFTAQPGDSVDGVPVKTFVRAEGQEIVTVSIIQTGATATITLGAVLLPTSFK